MKRLRYQLAAYLFAMCCLSLLIPSAALAQFKGKKSPGDAFLRTNPKFVKLFQPVVETSRKSTVQVIAGGKKVALGTVVGENGLVMTLASEVEDHDGNVKIQLADGQEHTAKVIAKEDRFNLALLKVDANDLVPVEWRPSKLTPVGSWAVSAGTGYNPVALGVVSVALRKMKVPKNFTPDAPRDQGYLGINLAPFAKNAQVDQVVPKSGAAKAGMRKGDVIIAIAGKEVGDLNSLRKVLGKYKYGKTVTVRVKRGEDQELDLKVTLGKRPASRGDVQNKMGSKLSERKSGFPVILQHDSIILPENCGGPLVNLEGKVIGINVARAGRTESYAIPTEAVVTLLEEMLAGKHVYTAKEKEKEKASN